MRYYFQVLALLILLLILTPIGKALADTNSLPQIMVGQTTMVHNGITSFGGFTGNEAVINYVPEYTIGFDPAYLRTPSDCYNGNISAVSWGCFLFPGSDIQGQNLGVGIMHGYTYVDSKKYIDLSALYYKPRLITGDTFGAINNFMTWGQNISETSTGNPYGTSPWQVKSYTLNSSSQSSWTGSEMDKYSAKINNLVSEATPISAGSLYYAGQWFLQSSSSPQNANSDDAEKYPEGKVWIYDGNAAGDNSLTVARPVQYRGKGTIIVRGNLNFWDPSSLIPADSESRLGIIVLNDVYFWSNITLKAAVFCKGVYNSANDSKNVDFVGSFVGRNFDIKNTPNNYNIRFNYDYKLSNSWPPGFRSLNMPREGS